MYIDVYIWWVIRYTNTDYTSEARRKETNILLKYAQVPQNRGGHGLEIKQK